MITNKKHIAFINEYFINGFNATQAYISVYKKVNEETAKVNGCKLLTNTNILAEISKRQIEIKEKHEITVEELVTVSKRIMVNNEDEKPGVSLKAIAELAKLSGSYATEKTETTIKTEQPFFGSLEDEE